MPRQPRFCPAGYPVHVIQRGNNRHDIFACEEDLAFYAGWLQEGAEKHNVLIHAWVFMTNHVHLLLTPSSDQATSHLMQFLGRQYVRRFNYRYQRTGTLFEGRFRSSLVESDRYLLACLQYIELNPVRAGIVTDPGDYPWSSYRCHAYGEAAPLWSIHPRYEALAATPSKRQAVYRKRISDALNTEAIARIRHCVNTGLVLGSEGFREQVGRLRPESGQA